MKLTKNIVISLLAMLIGLGGLVFCLIPGYSGPDKAVAKYVSAVNRANLRDMASCQISESDLLGANLDWFDYDLADEKLDPDNKTYSALKFSGMSAYRRVPKDAVKVKKVALCGCVDGEQKDFQGMTGYRVTAVVKVIYIDKDNNEQTIFCDEKFGILKVKGKYKIAHV